MKVKEFRKIMLKRMKTYRKIDFSGGVWFDDPCNYPYVRMVDSKSLSSKYLGRRKNEKIIGCSKAIKVGMFYHKKIFFLKEYDIGMPKEKEGYGDDEGFRGYPCEAIKFKRGEDDTKNS